MKQKVYFALFFLIIFFLTGGLYINATIGEVTERLEAIILLHKVEFLRENLLNKIVVVQADLLWWTPAEPFDAIYEQTCLCALDPADWREYARRLAGWLSPGGRLFALFMQTGKEGGPPYHCAMPAMRELFADDDWQWPASHPFEIPHPTGLTELACVLTRR